MTVRVDDQDGRKGPYTKVLDSFARGIEQDRERQRPAMPVRGDDRFELFVELVEVRGLGIVERQDLEFVSIGGVIVVKVDPVRQTAADARAAPETPEIDHDPLAFEVGDLDVILDSARGGDMPLR